MTPFSPGREGGGAAETSTSHEEVGQLRRCSSELVGSDATSCNQQGSVWVGGGLQSWPPLLLVCGGDAQVLPPDAASDAFQLFFSLKRRDVNQTLFKQTLYEICLKARGEGSLDSSSAAGTIQIQYVGAGGGLPAQ